MENKPKLNNTQNQEDFNVTPNSSPNKNELSPYAIPLPGVQPGQLPPKLFSNNYQSPNLNPKPTDNKEPSITSPSSQLNPQLRNRTFTSPKDTNSRNDNPYISPSYIRLNAPSRPQAPYLRSVRSPLNNEPFHSTTNENNSNSSNQINNSSQINESSPQNNATQSNVSSQPKPNPNTSRKNTKPKPALPPRERIRDSTLEGLPKFSVKSRTIGHSQTTPTSKKSIVNIDFNANNNNNNNNEEKIQPESEFETKEIPRTQSRKKSLKINHQIPPEKTRESPPHNYTKQLPIPPKNNNPKPGIKKRPLPIPIDNGEPKLQRQPTPVKPILGTISIKSTTDLTLSKSILFFIQQTFF